MSANNCYHWFSPLSSDGSRHGRQRKKKMDDEAKEGQGAEQRSKDFARKREKQRMKKTSLPGRIHLEPVVTSAWKRNETIIHANTKLTNFVTLIFMKLNFFPTNIEKENETGRKTDWRWVKIGKHSAARSNRTHIYRYSVRLDKYKPRSHLRKYLIRRGRTYR